MTTEKTPNRTLRVVAGRAMVDEHDNVVATVHAWRRVGYAGDALAKGLPNIIEPEEADRLVQEMARSWNTEPETRDLIGDLLDTLASARGMLDKDDDPHAVEMVDDIDAALMRAELAGYGPYATEPRTAAILVTGNPFDGMFLYGPFANESAAAEHGSRHFEGSQGGGYWTVTLNRPLEG